MINRGGQSGHASAEVLRQVSGYEEMVGTFGVNVQGPFRQGFRINGARSMRLKNPGMLDVGGPPPLTLSVPYDNIQLDQAAEVVIDESSKRFAFRMITDNRTRWIAFERPGDFHALAASIREIMGDRCHAGEIRNPRMPWLRTLVLIVIVALLIIAAIWFAVAFHHARELDKLG